MSHGSNYDDTMTRKDIPVSIIGGYLGAGKTTAVNRLLADDHGLRLAVLVNDFGAINIDAGLIANHGDQTIALTNGCVCCSIADDLGTALNAQAARPDPPDHIIVEASGVADPAKIGRFSDGWPGCSLVQITVLADISTIKARAADKFVGGLVQRQLQAGDRIVLNKCDLVSDGQATETAAWVSETAPGIPIINTMEGWFDPLLLADGQRSAPEQAVAHDGHQTTALRSFIWRPQRPVPVEVLQNFLAANPQIHRAKGVIVSPDGGRLLFNWSGCRADTGDAPAAAGEAVVVIGTFLPEAAAAFTTALDELPG